MQIERQVNRVLHDEHAHVQGLLQRLAVLLRQEHGAVLAPPTAETVRFLAELAGVLEHGLGRHFRFEEEELFPRLEEDGEGDMVALLREDHAILLPLAGALLASVRQARAEQLAASDWPAFRRLGLEFVERQVDHIEKEEMALLPALAETLDEDEDARIRAAYAAG